MPTHLKFASAHPGMYGWFVEAGREKNGVVDRYLSNHHDDDKHVLCCSLEHLD